jgi:hypothetical protein
VTGHVSGRRDQEDALTQRRLAADRLVLEVAGNELGKRAVALSIGLELVSLGGHRPSSEEGVAAVVVEAQVAVRDPANLVECCADGAERVDEGPVHRPVVGIEVLVACPHAGVEQEPAPCAAHQ